MSSALRIRKYVFSLFYILPVIVLSCTFISIYNKTWFFENQGIFILLIGVLTVWVCDWAFYRFLCNMLPEVSPIKEFNIKLFVSYIIGALGVIFTSISGFHYNPTYGCIVIMGSIIILPIIMLIVNKYVFSVIGTTLVICMMVLLIILAHPSNNFEKYNEKLEIANDFKHEEKYIAAIDLYNSLLSDKYFVNNYSDSMLKIALDSKNTAQQNIEKSQYPSLETHLSPSVAVSTPRRVNDAIEYQIVFSYNIGNTFSEQHIILNNFEANKKIIHKDDQHYIVRLTNIKAWSGYKNICILSGAAENQFKKSFTTPQSVSFRHINKWHIVIEFMLILLLIIIPFFFSRKLKTKEDS